MAWEQLISKALKNSPFLSFPREDLQKIEARRRSKRFVYARLAYQWKDDKDNPRRALPKELKEQLRSISNRRSVFHLR